MSVFSKFAVFLEFFSILLPLQVQILVQMSKWQNLISSKLTDTEKEYFRGKNDNGMCSTANGHRCFVGIVSKKMQKI